MPAKPVPVIEAPTPTVKVRAKLKAFGKTWQLVRPNPLLATAFASSNDNINAEYLDQYFMAHVHPDERGDFLVAARTGEGVDLVYLMELMEQMQEAVYSDGIEDEAANRQQRRAKTT